MKSDKENFKKITIHFGVVQRFQYKHIGDELSIMISLNN